MGRQKDTILKILIEAGGDVAVSNKRGRTGLQRAKKYGTPVQVSMIEEQLQRLENLP